MQDADRDRQLLPLHGPDPSIRARRLFHLRSRFLRSAVGTPDAAAAAHGERPGIAALLLAVDRKRGEIDARRLALPAPRRGRRVVIEPEPKTRADRGRVPKSDTVRHLEHLTRTF